MRVSSDTAGQAKDPGLDSGLSLGLNLPICPSGIDLPTGSWGADPSHIGAGGRRRGKEKGIPPSSLCLMGRAMSFPGYVPGAHTVPEKPSLTGRSFAITSVMRWKQSQPEEVLSGELGPSRGGGGREMDSSTNPNVKTIMSSGLHQNRPSARLANRPEFAEPGV